MSVGAGCPFPVTPVCDLVGGAASGLANDVLSGIVNWIVAGASWLLDQLGSVMASSTSVDLSASWFQQHYAVMASLAAVVAVPMLLLSAVQAVYRQSAAVLARAAFVHLPLAGLLTAVAVQLVQLSLTLTDALCATVTQSSGSDLTTTLESVAKVMVTSGASMPGFVLGLGALLVVIGALSLWLELIVRSAAVYVAVLFLPLAMASLVWPAVSHWCRRLVEALASIVLSKFVVVAVLSLALGALAKGSGFGALLTAGALLLLAAFMPFTLLRLVPMIESGAALQLESARQRLHQATAGIPRSAAQFAVRKAQSGGLTMDTPGTGTNVEPGLPGTDDMFGGGGGAGGGDGDGGDGSGGGSSGSGWGDGGWGGGGLGGVAGGMFDPDDPGGAMDEFPPTPADLEPPPGPIGLWPGDPRFSREALLAGVGKPSMGALPDSVGGMPGVERPFYGPTQPPSRFEPGPKDDWKGWQPGDRLEFTGGGGPAGFDPERYASMPYDGWAGRAPRMSTEAPIETPEDAWMWDRAVARDTAGDDQW